MNKNQTYYSHYTSPVGKLLLISDGTTITGMYYPSYKHVPKISNDWKEDNSKFSKLTSELNEYFSGKRKNFDVPLQLEGTEFQKNVWQQLSKIPYGATASYKDIATAVGKPKAVRAVGTAVGANPVCIIAPCHRVISSDGSLGGYAGGLRNKKILLKLEGNS